MSLAQTSRDSILDTIDLISNLAATPSHSQELLRELRKEFEITGQLETETKIQEIEQIEKESINIRRDLMTLLLEELQGDSKFWCLTKHLIASYGLSQELLQAYYGTQNESKYKSITDRVFNILLLDLKFFLSLPEIPTCSRCLSDSLQSKKQSLKDQTIQN